MTCGAGGEGTGNLKCDLIADRHKRLAQLQQSSKRNPHYQTLERDLIELQEQQLFELFVVVSLQKKPSGTSYIPQVIQQFPSKVGARWPGSVRKVPVCSPCGFPLVYCCLCQFLPTLRQDLTQALLERTVLPLQLPTGWELPA